MNNFNPIIKENSYTSSIFKSIPYPESSKTVHLLLSSKTNKKMIIGMDSSISPMKLAQGKFDKIVEIDVSPHTIEITEEVLTCDLISKFIVKITASVTVTSPDIVYENKVQDVAFLLKKEYLSRLEDAASDYNVKDFLQYKKEISCRIGKSMVLEEGIAVNGICVFVDMDAESKKYFEKIKKMEQESVINKRKAYHARELAENYGDLITSTYHEVVDGKITPLEAYKRVREIPFHQTTEVFQFIRDLQTSDIELEPSVLKQVNQLLGKLLQNTAESGNPPNNTMSLENVNQNKGDDSTFLDENYGDDFFDK